MSKNALAGKSFHQGNVSNGGESRRACRKGSAFVNGPFVVTPKKPAPNAKPTALPPQSPDNKTRLEAVKIVAADSEGLPVARQISIRANFVTLAEERKAMMLKSAAVQEALRELAEGENICEQTR